MSHRQRLVSAAQRTGLTTFMGECIEADSFDEPTPEFIARAFANANVKAKIVFKDEEEAIFEIHPDAKHNSQGAFSTEGLVNITKVLNRLNLRDSYLTFNPSNNNTFELAVQL